MKHKLHALSAALTLGLCWGIGLFVWTLLAVENGFGSSLLDLITEIYPFYEISIQGALWGLLWGFVDAFVGTYVVVWIYNWMVGKLVKK